MRETESFLKKSKSLETKLRSAIRLIWSRSKERREILKAASHKGSRYHSLADEKGIYFDCPICDREWPIQMAEVDHEPPIGALEHWQDVNHFIERMFFGPQRVLCKLCHRNKTNEQRKRKAA